MAYYWDFGDGTKLSFTGPYQSHIYSRVGNYTVVLEAVDDENVSASETAIVPVDPGPVFSPATPGVWDNVTFDGTPVANALPPSVYAQIQYFVANWYWDFGDGSSNGQVFNASDAWRTIGSPRVWHAYNNPGNYTVVLSITVVQTMYYTYPISVLYLHMQFNLDVTVHADPAHTTHPHQYGYHHHNPRQRE